MNEDIKKELVEKGVNVNDALTRCSGRDALFVKFLKIFFSDPDFGKLKESLVLRDYKNAYKFAHSLKGSSGNVGFEAFYFLAVDMVLKLKQDETDVDEIFDNMEKVYNDVKKTVEKL